MKKRVILYSLLLIGLQLLKGMLLLDYKADYGISRIEILVDNKDAIDDKIVSKEAYQTYYPIRTSYKNGINIGSLSHEVAMIVATDFNATDLERLKMEQGTFFGEIAGLEGRNVAIISDTIAIKLFGSTKAVGNKLHIENTMYQITGVYKRYRNLKDYRLDCGREKIYIPLKSELSKQWQVQKIAIDGTLLEALPDEKTLEEMGIDCCATTISDQSKWYKELKSLSKLPIMALAGLLIWEFFKYVPNLMRQDERIRTKFLKIGFNLILLVLLLKVSAIDFYISPQALPSENIFDIGFYWQALIREWARHNQFIENPISSFENAIYQLKGMIHMLNGIQMIVEINLLRQVFGRKKGIHILKDTRLSYNRDIENSK